MRIVKNEKLIKRRSRWARLILPVGLAALVVGFVLSLNQGNATAQTGSWLALVIGMLCASAGVYLADRWISLPNRPRADVTLEESLKSLDVKHKLYSFAVPPTEQLLLSPAGLTVFLVKKQDGTIECKDGRWRNKISIFQWLGSFTRERLGNPPQELEKLIGRVRETAQQAEPDAEVPVDGLIVLSSPRAIIKLDNCGDLIAQPDELRARFRDLNGGARRISDATYRRLEVALDGMAGSEVTETSTSRSTARPAGSSASTRSASAGRSRFTRPTRKTTPKEGEGLKRTKDEGPKTKN